MRLAAKTPTPVARNTNISQNYMIPQSISEIAHAFFFIS